MIPRSAAPASRPAPRVRAFALTLTLSATALSLSACSSGVRWEFGTFDEVRARTRASGQLTFIYFRNWYSVPCTRFEENVLKHPDVLAETRSMVCIPLEFDYDRDLARQWNLTHTPAFAIIAPDGRLLARGQLSTTVEQLLATIRNAQATIAPSTNPAAQP